MISPVESKPDLAKYQLHEEIGHGGMATVYRATDRRLGREVAVKVIHRHLRENREVAARFASEARAVAKLRHPNIVEVFDVSDEAEAERYLVVELVGGTTLRKLVQRVGHMPAEIAATVGLELCAALLHAHEAGVIHRDVKPENVLVELPRVPTSTRESHERTARERFPRVMLTDFGIAKLLDAQGVTSTGQVLGSPAHMAPEQIEGGDVSERSDVFALGVLLYECMVGHLPFEGKNPAQVLRRVLDGTYSPADRERQTIGAHWSAILDRSLRREASERFASIDELAAAIREQLALSGVASPMEELAEYLADPEAFLEPYVDRISENLVSRGEKARAAGDVPAAAALFNRALAFRPTDSELVARVTRLARGQRLRANVRRASAVLAVSVALGTAAYAVTRVASRPASHLAITTDEPDGVRAARPIDAPRRLSRASAVPEEGATPDRPGPKVQLRAVPRAGTAASAAGAVMRPVRIAEVYPANAIVRIDGAVVDQWFNVDREMAVGSTHRFEFLPPEGETCCIASSQAITVPDGAGRFIVSGRLAIRDARLAVAGPAGGRVTCPSLFLGRTLVPGQTHVEKMSAPTSSGECVLDVPGSNPVRKTVTLRAGETVHLSW